MTTNPTETRHPGPGMMNSPTYRPNGGPHGVLGAVGKRRYGPTPESVKKAYGVDVTADELRDNATPLRHVNTAYGPMPNPNEEPVQWFARARHILAGVAKRHGCVNTDATNRHIAAAMKTAQDDGCPFDLDYMADFVKREIDATREMIQEKTKMDAQPLPLPETKPPAAPTLYDVWAKKMKDLYGENAGREFARATSWKNWHEAKNKGTLTDAEIAAMLEKHTADAKRAADLDEVLGPDTPPEPPSQKPAEKAPQSDATPAPVADVPAPRSDAPTAPVATIAGQPAQKPQPMQTQRPTMKGPKVPEYHPLASADEVRAKYTIRVQGNREYLQVAGRILLFRMDHKAGRIETEMVTSTPDFFVFKASIYGTDGVLLATGHAMATVAGSAKFSGRTLEKAETSAIGRALAHAGYGTDQAGEDVDEEDMLSDSPIAA